MHASYCEGVIVIEMRKSFFKYDANLTSVITMEIKIFFFVMLISPCVVISCDLINV